MLELHKPLRFELNQITWSVLEVMFQTAKAVYHPASVTTR